MLLPDVLMMIFMIGTAYMFFGAFNIGNVFMSLVIKSVFIGIIFLMYEFVSGNYRMLLKFKR